MSQDNEHDLGEAGQAGAAVTPEMVSAAMRVLGEYCDYPSQVNETAVRLALEAALRTRSQRENDIVERELWEALTICINTLKTSLITVKHSYPERAQRAIKAAETARQKCECHKFAAKLDGL